MSLITVTDVRKRFGDNEVLKGIDLDIEAGEVIAIIGKSGSGKSTLLRCINGLETINSGSISVGGAQLLTDDLHLRALRLKVGMIFQQFNLFPHLTAGRNVMLSPMIVKKVPEAEAEPLARKMLERVGLHRSSTRIRTSYRVDSSNALRSRVRSPCSQVRLLCDEITSALDPELVNEVLAVVGELAKEGMTLLMVTHEMRFAREVCDRVVFMHLGRVHEIGPPEEVFTHPRTAELQQFLGMVQ